MIDPSEAPTQDVLFRCRCETCQCDAVTPHATHVCYTCRGGSGVAHVPFAPAHHAKPRQTMPKYEPVK